MFERARKTSSPNPPSVELYLSLLAYRLTGEETEGLISKYRFPRSLARALRDSSSLKARVKALTAPNLAPSRVYALLRDLCLPAVVATSLATDSPVACRHIQAFLTRLRYIRPALTGSDLQKMGIPPGPRMKEILQRLHEARLDGKVKTKKGEEEMVGGWLVNR